MNRFDISSINDEIESFKAELNFPNFKPPENINKIITELSNLEHIRKLSAIDLSEYAILLSNYSLFITTQENRLHAYINWLESNLKHIVGSNLDNAPGYGFNEKDHYIRSKDNLARELDEKKLAASMKFDQFKNISFKLQMLADTIDLLVKEKRKHEYAR